MRFQCTMFRTCRPRCICEVTIAISFSIQPNSDGLLVNFHIYKLNLRQFCGSLWQFWSRKGILEGVCLLFVLFFRPSFLLPFFFRSLSSFGTLGQVRYLRIAERHKSYNPCRWVRLVSDVYNIERAELAHSILHVPLVFFHVLSK